MFHTRMAMFAAGAWLAVVSAASTDVLSDNLSSPPSGSPEPVSATSWIAASFGTDARAYELTGVVLRLVDTTGVGAQVELYTSTGPGIGKPGAPLGLLTASLPLPTSIGDVSFSTSGIPLNPWTTYWVVVKALGSGAGLSWEWTQSNVGTGVGFQHTWGSTADFGLFWQTQGYAPQMMRVSADKKPWADLGFALTGSFGDPELTGTGLLVAGTPMSLSLTNASSFSIAVLFVATTSAPTPLYGGTLLPAAPWIAHPFVVDLTGAIDISVAAWPAGASGTALYLQYAIQDMGAIQGVALSNALRADIP